LAYRLNTIHNLYYILNLMAGLRRAIREGRYQAFARQVLSGLSGDQGEEAA
jgi:queuine tRNA-ribosyltransferase